MCMIDFAINGGHGLGLWTRFSGTYTWYQVLVLVEFFTEAREVGLCPLVDC